MLSVFRLFRVLVLGVACLLFVSDRQEAQANVPFTAVSSCVVTVTNTARTIAFLMTAAACPVDVGECSKVANDKPALVCVGSSAVTTSTAVGARCWPVCLGGADCAESVTSVPYSIGYTYLRAPVAQKAYILVGNGC